MNLKSLMTMILSFAVIVTLAVTIGSLVRYKVLTSLAHDSVADTTIEISGYATNPVKLKVSDLYDVAIKVKLFEETNYDVQLVTTKRGALATLTKAIDDAGVIQEIKPSVTKDSDGYYQYDEGTNGNSVDCGKVLLALTDTVKTALSDGTTDTIKFSLNGFYSSNDLTAYKKAYSKLLDYESWQINYDDVVTLSYSDIKDFVSLDGTEVKTDFSDVSALVKKVADAFNTVGLAHKFSNHAGEAMTVSGGTYGWEVDEQKETEFIKQSLAETNSVFHRTPAFSHVAHSKIFGSSDIGNTYIEVNLAKQCLWYIHRGEVKYKSDIVSGTYGKHDTPTGVFFVSEITDGKYLVGDGYKTWVNKWLRLTETGVGLHDATWRSVFGGDIYKSSGSHGCINLPAATAEKLFKRAYYGMPVVIY